VVKPCAIMADHLLAAFDVTPKGQEAADTSGHRLDVVEAMEREGVVTWGDDGHRARFLALREAADTSGLRAQLQDSANGLHNFARMAGRSTGIHTHDTHRWRECSAEPCVDARAALAAGATERPLDVDTVAIALMECFGNGWLRSDPSDPVEEWRANARLLIARLSPTATPEAGDA
jgi:hypothetical protein